MASPSSRLPSQKSPNPMSTRSSKAYATLPVSVRRCRSSSGHRHRPSARRNLRGETSRPTNLLAMARTLRTEQRASLRTEQIVASLLLGAPSSFLLLNSDGLQPTALCFIRFCSCLLFLASSPFFISCSLTRSSHLSQVC